MEIRGKKCLWGLLVTGMSHSWRRQVNIFLTLAAVVRNEELGETLARTTSKPNQHFSLTHFQRFQAL